MTNLVTSSANGWTNRAMATYHSEKSVDPHAIGPLSVLVSPSGQYAVEAGESFDISLTIHNQGMQGAIIDVYVDESSATFCKWCSNPYERLALEVGHSNEVRFKVTVPVQTLPGTYDYLIVVDAPNHYPEDTPLRYPARVQVLPPVRSDVNLNDVTFATSPESSSAQPVVLPPATPVAVKIIVHNRSDQVDQFRLEIEDLPKDWYQLRYPEGLGELGLVLTTDHLALNPGARGVIQMTVNCPRTVLAGRYFATLRLHSINDPDLVLMDVLYFEVPPRYELALNAETIIRKIKHNPALVYLHITNAGNTAREISLQTQEDQEDPLFDYTIEPQQLRISSMGTVRAELRAVPARPGRRAWLGKGHETNTRLVMVDHHKLPLPEASTVNLLWQRRPWWHLLLVILTATGIVGAIALLLWWFFGRALAPPKVMQFDSTAPTYYQQNDDFVRLTWRIDNPKQIEAIEIQGQATGANPPQPIRYDFSNGMPAELADHCVQDKQLVCGNIFTSARQPGSYQFTLNILSKGKQGNRITAETGAIAIHPTPPPAIRHFAPTQQRYWEALAQVVRSEEGAKNTKKITAGEGGSSEPGDSSLTSPHQVGLDWQIMGVGQLSFITLVGRLEDGSVLDKPQRYDLTDGLPQALEPFCRLTETELVCRAFPTTASTVGKYVFELSVFGADESTPIVTQKTDAIAIVPAPVQIESFTIDGESPTKYSVQLPPPADNPNTAKAVSNQPDNNQTETVRLEWKVQGGAFTQVELLPSPGSVSLAGKLDYPLTANTQEVLTLRVTSVTGQQVTRSITLEALAPLLPEPAIVSPPPVPPAAINPASTSHVPMEVPSPSTPISAESNPEASSPENNEVLRPEPSAPTVVPAPILTEPDNQPKPSAPPKSSSPIKMK